jgi:hypothetical protein
MNHKKAVAARNRQREALTTRIADNDQKPTKKTTPTNAPKAKPRGRVGISLARVSICRSDD